ncbi:MAG TPA: hypothetical protein VFC00_30860 [Micromonosporaceae bacterium]|nr:hypothetical protein [Micromonosporaceae bacterium]
MTNTNATATFILVQRDQYGDPVNTITGLDELSANNVLAILTQGDAYHGAQPWSCEIVAELTPAEKLAAVVDSWLAGGESLTRADHIVACLRRVADLLETLGGKVIPRTGLKVELHLFSSDGSNEERMTALDVLAAVFGRKGEMSEGQQYHTGHLYGGGLRMVTIPKPAEEPRPLVSDDEPRCPSCGEPERLLKAGTVGHAGDHKGYPCEMAAEAVTA